MSEQRFTPEPPIYTFRVRILGCMAGFAPKNATEIQREIAIAANQTLADLADAIPRAYGFDDPHMWSFFLSGKAWDTDTEYTMDYGDDPFFPEDLLLAGEGDEEDDDEDKNDGLFPLPTATELAALPLTQAFITDYLNSLPAPVRDQLREQVRLMMPGVSNEPTAMDEAFMQLFLSGAPPEVLAGLEANLRDTPADERAAMLGEFRADALDQFIAPPSGLADLFGEEKDPAGWADETLIRDVPYPGKTGKKEFLFLFDYGDEWRFGVKLLGTSEKKTPRARYPRVTARRGRSPSQYPRWADDDDWDDGEWGEEEEGDAAAPRSGIILRFDPKTGIVTQETIEIPPRAKE